MTEIIEQTPYGFVRGEAVFDLPRDLYIPPDALEVVLDIFEGPLDLLLYLIKKHNIDILNIPVAAITRQYMDYVQVISALRLELAADYLEMAATLTEIKSRLLLPKPPSDSENTEELDPRAELVRRLQQYERFKIAATQIEGLPRLERDYVLAAANPPPMSAARPHPHLELDAILSALKQVLSRIDLKSVHHIQREVLSVREKMSLILSELQTEFVDFVRFFDPEEGRLGIIVTFLAILELVRESVIELMQQESFGPIYIRANDRAN
jgi:segregation and condensation protein A